MKAVFGPVSDTGRSLKPLSCQILLSLNHLWALGWICSSASKFLVLRSPSTSLVVLQHLPKAAQLLLPGSIHHVQQDLFCKAASHMGTPNPSLPWNSSL